MESNSAEEELNIPLAAAKIEIPDPVQNAKKPEDSGDSLPKDCDTVNSQEETHLAKCNSKLEEVRTCLSKEEEGELSSEYESADEEVENEEVNNEESLLVDNEEEEEEDPVKEALKEEDKNDKEEEEREEDFIDEDYLKEQEASMSEEEKEAKREEAQNIKAEGNNKFKELLYVEAALDYTNALQLCPLCFAKERAIMYSNRAACKLKQGKEESSIKDCSRALELHPHYMKALLRRAELYERTEKLDEALADYQKALEMDPMLPVARAACMRLPDMIKERNEKMKEEMMGKLKDLGNMILKPFGLSTSNFNLQQDPNTGSYSVNFQQGAQQQ